MPRLSQAVAFLFWRFFKKTFHMRTNYETKSSVYLYSEHVYKYAALYVPVKRWVDSAPHLVPLSLLII